MSCMKDRVGYRVVGGRGSEHVWQVALNNIHHTEGVDEGGIVIGPTWDPDFET